jgi:hypothetical protein
VTGLKAETFMSTIAPEFLGVHRYRPFDVDWVRYRDRFRHVNRVRFGNMDRYLDRDGYLHRDLDRVRNILFHRIRNLLLYIHRVGFGYFNRVWFYNFDLHGDLDRVWDFLDDLNSIRLGDRHFDLLGDDDSLDVLWLVLNAVSLSVAIAILIAGNC